ncbi:MAG: hypothetical protein GY817_02835 [bacterium]|nr:hypothetical protein [bacterium]
MKKLIVSLIFTLMLLVPMFARTITDLRRQFARSENSRERAEILLKIAERYESADKIKNAKLLYRQIIQNYFKSQDIVKKSEERLLKL